MKTWLSTIMVSKPTATIYTGLTATFSWQAGLSSLCLKEGLLGEYADLAKSCAAAGPIFRM